MYHREVQTVDAVVEAPGEDEVVCGVGEDAAVDPDLLQFVGLEHSLCGRVADGSIWKKMKVIIESNSYLDTLTPSDLWAFARYFEARSKKNLRLMHDSFFPLKVQIYGKYKYFANKFIER